MKYRCLATDYDGTIAFDGKVDAATVASLQRVRAAGHRLIMVTGRELTDLFNTFDQIDLFDLVVAENGATLYDPRTKEIVILAPPPPESLTARLMEHNVPFSVGHSIVATVEPHEQTLIAAIHDLRIDWHVIFNKGSVMALPSDVTKATGLASALGVVGVPWAATIGVGDAENDLPFLRRCGFAAAVRNALPSVQEIADLVTAEVRGAGVAELIGGWLNGGLSVRHAGTRQERDAAASHRGTSRRLLPRSARE